MGTKLLFQRDLRELLTLAWPVVLSRIGVMTMGLVDVIVVGRFSSEQLGFHALGWAPTAAILTAAIGLTIGVGVMTSRHIGEGRPEATGGVFRRGLVYSFWVSVLAAAVLQLGGRPIMQLMGFDQRLAGGAVAVMTVLAWSMPFQLMAVTCSQFLEGLQRPKAGMIAMWGCNVLNLVLNLVLVPGVAGIPAFGAVGSCWATFGSRAALFVILIIYIARMHDARALGVFSAPTDGPKAAREQRVIGYGGGASYFVEAGAFSAMNFIAGLLGATALAGWAVVLNVASFIFMAPVGLSAATGVLVSRAYGAGDKAGVVRFALLGFAVTIGVLALVSIGVAAFAPQIARIYTTETALVAITAAALVLCCLFYIADGLQVVAAQVLRSRSDVLTPTMSHIFAYAIFMVPAGYVLAVTWGYGLNGIVYAVIAASFLAAGLQVGRFAWLARR